MKEFAQQNRDEAQLYTQFHKHYGYVFYIAKRG